MSLVSNTSGSIRWIPAPIARHPALVAASCLAIGVFIGDAIDTSTGRLFVVTLVAGLIGLVLRQSAIHSSRVLGILSICLMLIALGAWRIAVTNSGRPSPSLTELTAAGRRVNIFGRIDGVPYQKSTGLRVPLDMISIRGKAGDLPVHGRVLMTSIPSLQGLRHGDFIRFEGRVFAPSAQRNPGGFDYAEYLHRQGFDATARPESQLSKWPQEKHWSFHNIVDPLRQWIRASFSRNLDNDPQALLVGLLLGDTDRLPKSVYNAFRESGTSHLLAVSGANVWLVVGMFLLPMYAFSVPRWPRTVIALVVIVFFSFLTRNEPSVVRASLMVAFILAGQLLWRPAAPINAVGGAALIILLIAPAQLFRSGFQLSFAAVIGILIAVGRVEPRLKGFWRHRLVYTTVLFLVASVAATIATAPVSAWHFGTVPIAGLISNLIMVPLAGLTAHLGLLLLPLQEISTVGTRALASLIEHLLSFSTVIAQFFANYPWSILSWPSPSPLVLIHFVFGIILILNWRYRYQWLRPLVYYVCFAMIVSATLRLITPTPSFASISLLDTGRQRVAILSSNSGRTVGIIDDPGLEDEIDQWVVQPFLRHQIGAPSLDKWTSWRRLESSDSVSIVQNSQEGSWKRLYTTDNHDSLGQPRICADIWQAGIAHAVMFRDPIEGIPDRFFGLVENSQRPLALILPSEANVAWLREAIDRSDPAIVVLYGRQPFGQTSDETLAFWRMRYPGVEFYSTAVHGGITIDLLPDQIVVNPTVSVDTVKDE